MIHAHIHTYIHACIYSFIHVCLQTYIHAYTFMQVCWQHRSLGPDPCHAGGWGLSLPFDQHVPLSPKNLSPKSQLGG